MKERLTNLIEALGMNINSFSKHIGVAEGTTRMYIDRGSKPKSDYMEKVFRAIENLNPRWWLTGEGEMFLLNEKPDHTSVQTKDDHSSRSKAQAKGGNVKSENRVGADNTSIIDFLRKELDDCKKALEAERNRYHELVQSKQRN